MPAPAITAFPFFVYPVTDMDRSCAFYRDILGLTEIARWENSWVEFSFNPSDAGPALALSTDMANTVPGAQGSAIALESPDFDAMVAHLRAHGVTFAMAPAETSACHFARFLDPDGNHLVLHRIHD
ncbi:MAG: VOC family protein [Candidatus Synoicihabitans palmerolidicus]|nr:VOC family protein [Candidatus Synoicihabitans palmerolidicus]